MWPITHWRAVPKCHDFTSSGQGRVNLTAIEVEDVELCNGVELCDWEEAENRMQVILCQACGIVGCESGGWITFRRTVDHVFWLPLFSERSDEEPWAAGDYGPPNYVRKRGIPYFTHENYTRFQRDFPRFPHPHTFPPLSQGEAMRCFQHEAPARLLGDIYKAHPHHRLSLILAANEGDHERWCGLLLNAFSADLEAAAPARISAPEVGDRILSIFPDLPQFPEWPLFWLGAKPGYYLTPDLKLESDGLERLIKEAF